MIIVVVADYIQYSVGEKLPYDGVVTRSVIVPMA